VFSNPNAASVDDLYQHLGGHLLWQKLRELEKVLQRRGVRFSLLKNERLSAQLVSQYLNVKQRQLI
jgi:thermostable 8-oxoguanine DNA glycosylase